MFIGALIYIGRVRVNGVTFFLDDRTMRTEFCAIDLFILSVGVFALVTVWYAVLPSRHLLPLLLMLGCPLLGWHLPLPMMAEEVLFSSHKAEYKQVVELARNNQLVPSDESENCLALPAGYKSAGETIECIKVPEQQSSKFLFILRTRRWSRGYTGLVTHNIVESACH
jgi:hypothetical protein